MMMTDPASILFALFVLEAAANMNLREEIGAVTAVSQPEMRSGSRYAEVDFNPFVSTYEVRYRPENLKDKPTIYLKFIAYHEVCHVLIEGTEMKLGVAEGHKWSEDKANRCAEIWLETLGTPYKRPRPWWEKALLFAVVLL
jgi:hypothetical protein